MATQIGATLAIAGQTAVAGYIVESERSGGNEIDFEDVFTAAGVRTTRIVFRVDGKKQLSLIALTGSTFSEFVEGAKSTASGLTDYFVDSCVVTKTKGALRGEISLTDIDI